MSVSETLKTSLKNMFVKNTTKEDIGPITFEGYEFIIPADSVSAIYNPAGEWFTTHNFKVESKDPTAPNWVRRGETMVNIGGDGGAPLPPVYPVTEEEWDGKTYVMVTRFKMDHTRVPNRNDLIRVAAQRGVDKETLDRFNNEEPPVDNPDIVNAINKLPIPEDVRIPEEPRASKVKVK
jgi:hypothetical protein